MVAIDSHEVLRRLSVGIVQILVRYRVSPQLQLWHLYLSVSVQPVSDLHSHVPYVTLLVSRRRCTNRRNTLASG
jgi:hypothetical protein